MAEDRAADVGTSDGEALLAVQELDTAADVLRHRRTALPARVALAERHAVLAALEVELAPTHGERHRIERAQKALEDELSLLAEKRAGVEAQMYGGASSNAKELQILQDELDSFDRRRATLEDQVLERMVELEPLDDALAAAGGTQAAVDLEAIALTAELAEAEATIDAELADVTARRDPAAGAVEGGLLARYEALRTRLRGVGVGRLDGARCTGCHLTLPAAEAEAVRKQARADGIAECPECTRLLVV